MNDFEVSPKRRASVYRCPAVGRLTGLTANNRSAPTGLSASGVRDHVMRAVDLSSRGSAYTARWCHPPSDPVRCGFRGRATRTATMRPGPPRRVEAGRFVRCSEAGTTGPSPHFAGHFSPGESPPVRGHWTDRRRRVNNGPVHASPDRSGHVSGAGHSVRTRLSGRDSAPNPRPPQPDSPRSRACPPPARFRYFAARRVPD